MLKFRHHMGEAPPPGRDGASTRSPRSDRGPARQERSPTTTEGLSSFPPRPNRRPDHHRPDGSRPENDPRDTPEVALSMTAARDDNKDSRSADCDIDAGQAADMQPPVAQGYLRLRDAAQRLGLTSREVRQLLAAGQLSGY